MGMAQPVIETRGLTKRYGERLAVAGLDLAVYPGEVFGFLGPNGAGKTTTVRMLTTLTRPSGGRAWVSGHDVVRQPLAAKRGMGVVSQHLNLDPDLTVYENLLLHARLHGLERSRRRQAMAEMLAFAGLEARAGEPARRLSGGLKRRLMIARALLHGPRVLFLDEPTVGLDAHSRRRTWELIRACHRRGVTVFLTTHYIEEAESLCQRVGIIHQGRLMALDRPQALLARTGRVAVEDVARGETRFFPHRAAAAAYAAGREGDVVIRRSNLEDVFLSLTGRRVEEAPSPQPVSTCGHHGKG